MSAKEFFLSWGMLLIGVFMNVFGIYFVKAKINALGSVQFDSFGAVMNYFLNLAKSPIVIVSGVFVLAAPFPYVVALSRMQLSTAYPLSVALNCLIVLPLSVFCLGETITLYKIIGILMILVSIYLLYR